MNYDGSIKIDTKLDTTGLQSGISSLMGSLKKLGTALAIGKTVKEIVQAGMSFESAFTGVAKTVDATEQQLSQLCGGIRELSKELPESVNEIANVAAAAGQLGIGTEYILEFSKTMTMLGDATNLTAESAAVTLARFANITGMSQENFDRLGSTVVELGNHFATTETEIADMALNIASAGSQVGMTEAQIMGFATALSAVGMTAQAGGTSISKLIRDMQIAVETGSDKLQQFATVAGVSAEQFAEAFRNDAAGAVISFISGLNDTERHGMSAIAILDEMGITERRLSDAILRAAGSGDLFRSALESGTKAWKENTALTTEASRKYETLESKLGILKNHLVDLGISIYDGMAGPLKEAVETVTGELEVLSDRITGGNLQSAVAGLGETFGFLMNVVSSLASMVLPPLVAVLGAIGPQLDILIPSVLSAVTAFKAFQVLDKIESTVGNLLKVFLNFSNPLGLACVAISGLMAMFLGLQKAINRETAEEQKFRKSVEQTTEALQNRRQEYEDYKKTQADTVNAVSAQIGHTKSLAQELMRLADANGNVQEADKTRASFILTQLNAALGTEYQLVGNQIQGYQELKSSIYDLLEAKRLETMMSVAHEGYQKSFEDESQVVTNLRDAYHQLLTKQQEYGGSIVELTAKNEEYSEKRAQAIAEGNALEQSYYEDEIAANNHKIDGLKSYQEAYETAAQEHLQLLKERDAYETAYALAAEGRTEEALAWLQKSNQGYLEAEEAIASYGEKTEETVTALADTVTMKLLEASGAMELYSQTGTESAKNQMVSSMSEMLSAVVTFTEQGGTVFDNYLQTINGTTIDLTPFRESLITEAYSLGQMLKEEGKDAGGNLDTGLILGMQDLEGMTVQEILEYTSGILQEFETGLEEHSPSKATERNGRWLIEGLLNGISNAVGSVLSAVSGFCETVKSYFSSFFHTNTLVATAGNLISGIANGISSFTWTVLSAVSTLCSGTISAFSSYLNGSTLFSIGSSVIQGLINGIRSMASAVFAAVADIAGALAGIAQRILSIHSPSKVFRDQVGKPISEGMAVGIEANAGMVTSAVAQMAYDAVAAAKKALDSHSPSKKFENQVGKTIPQGVAVGIKENSHEVTDAVKQMFDDLALQKELGAISEAKYYQTLKEYRDEYLEEETKEWWDYTKELIEYDETLRDRKFKNLEWFHSNSLISDSVYYQMLGRLRDQYFAESDGEWQDYTEKILNYQLDLVNDAKQAYDRAVEKGVGSWDDWLSPVLTVRTTDADGTVTESYKPNNFFHLNRFLPAFKNTFEQLWERVGDDEVMMSVVDRLLELDPEDAFEQAQILLDMDDKAWTQYVSDTKSAYQTVENMKELYGRSEKKKVDEQSKALVEVWLDNFGTLPEESYNIGVKMIESLVNGALSQMPAFHEMIAEGIFSVLGSTGFGFSADGGLQPVFATGGGDTYIIQAPGSTVGESIQALKKQSVLNRLRGC